MGKSQVIVSCNGTEVTVKLSSSSVSKVVIDEAEFTIKLTQAEPDCRSLFGSFGVRVSGRRRRFAAAVGSRLVPFLVIE